MTESNQITCKGCGAVLKMDAVQCPYCRGPVNITTFQSVYEIPAQNLRKYVNAYQKELQSDEDSFDANKAVAFCYMKIKMYDKAVPFFDKAIENNFDDADVYLYAAVCMLKGKRPFTATKPVIDRAIQYLQSACMIEDKGIYHYLLAYLKFDYYDLKGLQITPGAIEEMQTARAIGFSNTDSERMFELLGTPKPDGF